jgi:hypothetical protein
MKNFLNKRVKLIFEDGQSQYGQKHYSKKVGVVIEVTEHLIILKINGNTEAINLNKVLRIEEF